MKVTRCPGCREPIQGSRCHDCGINPHRADTVKCYDCGKELLREDANRVNRGLMRNWEYVHSDECPQD